MNKNTLRPLILMAFIVNLAFIASGRTIKPSSTYKTKTVNCSEIEAICTNTSIDIVYCVGNQKVEIYAPDNILPYIEVVVQNKELRVNYKENMTFEGSHKTKVTVTAPAVTRFKSNSSGGIIIKDNITLKDKDIELMINSAGDISALNIEGKDVMFRTNSAGDIKTGNVNANQIKLICNSAGNIETGNLIAQNNIMVNTNSAGDIKVPKIVAGLDAQIHANSAGDIKVDTILSDKTLITANSAGDIKTSNVKSNIVSATTNSAGSITISGICEKASLSCNMTGYIKAGELQAKIVAAITTSLGNISCNALETITITKRGSGDIIYTGNPTNVLEIK